MGIRQLAPSHDRPFTADPRLQKCTSMTYAPWSPQAGRFVLCVFGSSCHALGCQSSIEAGRIQMLRLSEEAKLLR